MREHWDNRPAFVLAAIGSAIGLGNVWRFPYICFKYGGGAFLIPYIIALFTAGIPLLILEFSLGHKMAASAPESFRKIGVKKEWLGWFAILVALGITAYYAVIMSWCGNYFCYSFNLSWGKDTADFFNNKFLAISNGPLEIGKMRLIILPALIVTWVAIIGCIWKGPKTVSKVVYITVILPWIILIIFVIRGVTLPGAIEGLKYFLTPNFQALKDIEVWRNAYAQVFFSLSIGFGIMIAYASYLPPKKDIVNNAFIIGLADAGTAFLAGFAVFSVLGYYSYVQGIPVPETIKSSIPLAFITYPTIINLLPFANKLFGALFFLMLLTLGIDSAFSLVEAISAGFIDKWKIKRHTRVRICTGVVALIMGLIYITQGGLYWLDIIDYFMSNFGLIIVGLLECIVLGYMFKLKVLKDHVNPISEIKIGKLWEICVKVITPLVLIFLLGSQIVERIKTPYGGYPRSAEFIGLCALLLLFLVSILLMNIRRRNRSQK